MAKKRKILLISDHLLSVSGVGTQSRFLVNGLVSKGTWTVRQLGGAVKHADYRTVKVNEDIIIKPVDGFGTKDMVRLLLATEKPDVMLLFTDPRFFIDKWEMEEEIHQVCPIAYWHLWDNGPAPEFNRVLYESTDLLNCINWPTYKFCKKRWPEKTNYIPHALPGLYRTLPEADVKHFKHNLLRGKCDDHMVGLWVNRNARRKQPGDVMTAWKIFLDELEARHGHRKATLLMHTDPHDREGPNLFVIADMLGIKENVFFSSERFEFEQMNVMYNIADFTINISSAEGFGLTTLESMHVGRPIVALKTGGLTRQVVNHETGFEYGVALDVDVKSLVGSQLVPAIYDDYVDSKKVAAAFMKMYEMGHDKRRELGKLAQEYAKSEYSYDNMVEQWDKSLNDLIDRWQTNRKSVYRPWEVRKL